VLGISRDRQNPSHGPFAGAPTGFARKKTVRLSVENLARPGKAVRLLKKRDRRRREQKGTKNLFAVYMGPPQDERVEGKESFFYGKPTIRSLKDGRRGKAQKPWKKGKDGGPDQNEKRVSRERTLSP